MHNVISLGGTESKSCNLLHLSFLSEIMHDFDEILSDFPGQDQWLILGLLKFKLKKQQNGEQLSSCYDSLLDFIVVVWKAISISQFNQIDAGTLPELALNHHIHALIRSLLFCVCIAYMFCTFFHQT